jgi:hypothetical protein
MSNVWVRETVEERNSGYDASYRRTYTRVFKVLMSSKEDGPVNVRASTGVPRLFDGYLTSAEFDTGAFVSDIKCDKDKDSPYLWKVTVTYSSGDFGGGGAVDPLRQNENPILRPADVRWGFTKYQRAAEKDVLGRAIINSAGLPFDPPYMIDDNRPVLTINRNELSFSPMQAWDYKDAVNIDAFMNSPPQTCKCTDITGDLQWERGLAFWRVTYSFEFRPIDGWIFRPMDRGKAYRDRTSGKLKAICINGVPTSEPMPLNGKGEPAGSTTLTAIAAVADTTVTVASTVTFNSDPPFEVQCELEDMRVQQVNTGTPGSMFVARAINGTTAAQHPNGSVLRQKPVFMAFNTYKLKVFANLQLP